MNKLHKVENKVLEVLIEVPETRDDDFLLLSEVYKRVDPTFTSMPFGILMEKHRDLGVPYFESVTRARRKIQSKHKELRATREVQEARAEEQDLYIEYATDGMIPAK